MKNRYQLDNELDIYALHKYAKLEVLKGKLREDINLEISTVETLKKYVDNLLAYPTGGIILRHPLFTTSISITLSALVSISITASRNNIDTDALLTFVGAAIVFIFFLLVFLPALSPLVDDLILGEERFFHEMRTLLIILEAELQEENARTSPTS